MSAGIKKDIEKEFEEILRILDFKLRAHDYFRRWYVDGRLFFHKVIDTANPKQGLTDVRYIDPRKIKKVREIIKEKDTKTNVDFIKRIDEYFLYNEKGVINQKTAAINDYSTSSNALRITKDAICHVPSGLVDQDKNVGLSYLHKAIRPANQLRMMENALVIYRITRAPERRVFYVDVGNLPKIKAEQYLKGIMNQYRNKIVYDSNTGEIRDDKKFMSMLEDFWLPRREGGRGTQIETLPGGENLGQIQDVEFFQRKLYQSLNVPISRQQQQSGLNFGRAAEINRDEWKFTKFIARLRRRFSLMFDDLLKTQLILKGIITEADWESIKYKIQYNFATDAYYTESKEQQILQSRIEILNGMANYIGSLYSKEYVQKNILKLTDDEIAEIEASNTANPPEVPPAEEQPPQPEQTEQG
jgi:DNA-dependent RNA polymerase auxiliary subunit epsilon